MYDEFDSFDDTGYSFDDMSVDDLSSAMDEATVMNDDISSLEDFEEIPESDSDDMIMDVMDATESSMDLDVFEDDLPQYEDSEDWSGDGLIDESDPPAEEITPGEIPENSGLDSMAEYMAEHNYGFDDFETYSKDPEWQQLNNDLLEEMGQEPIDYGETVVTSLEEEVYDVSSEPEQSIADIMDEVDVDVDDAESLDDVLDDNVNLPAADGLENTEEPYDLEHNVEFIDSLVEERPELAEMFRNGEFFEQGNNEHGFESTCGETTQANTLNKVLGTNEITENDVLDVAIDKNLCEVNNLEPTSSGGTNTEQFMQLYDEMNHRVGDKLDVELFDYDDALSVDDMVSRIENGSVLNIAVDSYELWDEPRDVTDTAHYTDHWISVTGVDRDSDGAITGFKIIDSGGGENYLDIDKFERCYYGPKDDPVIDPTCIVVSRKGDSNE